MTSSQSLPTPTGVPVTKILIQCDFDGTVTIEDASFIMLDAFARGDWRRINQEYEAGRITVGRFNSEAFGLVEANRRDLLNSIEEKVHVRHGFKDFAIHCFHRGLRLVIVSNGLDFYINEILTDIGLPEIEVHAARTVFHDLKVDVSYIGPDGSELDDAFKEAYVERFRSQGYRVVYVGNGSSDLRPAQKSDYVFATGTLLSECGRTGLRCAGFDDFHDVLRGLAALGLK